MTESEEKRLTQKMCFNAILELFRKYIVNNRTALDSYNYCNNAALEYIQEFRRVVECNGMTFSKAYHANGIGNNNEYLIYVRELDEDGFAVDKNIANFYYCLGIYGGCYVKLNNLATGDSYNVGHAH